MILWFRGIFRVIAVVMALLAGSGIASIAAAHDHDKARQAVESREIRPLAEILNIVQDKLPGEVVRTELERKNNLWVYEFRVVDRKGRVFEVYVDAHSGEIKRIKEK